MPRYLRPLMMVLALSMIAAACAGDENGDDGDTGTDTDTDTDTDAGDEGDEGDEGDDEASGERQMLRVGGFAADMALTDPQFANTGMDRQILLPMFEGLVRYIPNDMLAGFEPAIATEVPEAPEPNDDGTQTWEFEIREGVMCHGGPDGEPYEITAEMVAESYRKTSDSNRAAFASDYAVVDSIEAADNTVSFQLSAPRSADLFLPLVADFAGGYVVCMDHLEGGYDDLEGFNAHPVGTGPFEFVEYNPGNNTELAANDDYWRGEPLLSGIDIRFMPDDSSRTLALQSGEIDFMYGVLEQEWLDRIGGEDGLTAIAMPVGGLHSTHFNKSIEPFDQLEVRQALAYAHNRDAHIAVSGADIKLPACSLEPLPDHPGGLSCEEVAGMEGLEYVTEFDPELAREMLADAGFPDGFSFEVTSSELEIYRDHYTILQSTLAEAGVDMQIDVVDHPTMHSVIRENANGLVVYLAPRPTIEQHMMQFAHSSAIVVEGESPVTNFSHFDGADDIIEEAQVTIDSDAQNELWREANRLILEDAAIIPNTHDNDTFAWRDGFDPGTATNASLESSFKLGEYTSLSD